MLQAPTAYALVPSNKQYTPQAPPFQPNQMICTCPFCKASNCVGWMPREFPIGQEYVWLGKVIICEQGFYRWPNNSCIPNNPKGIKFVVNQAQTSTVPEAAVAFLKVDPVDKDMVMLEEEESVLKETRGAYPAIVTPDGSAVKPQGSANADQKPSQYTYKSKCNNDGAIQRVFEHVMAVRVDVSMAELMALSPDFHKYMVDFCKVK